MIAQCCCFYNDLTQLMVNGLSGFIFFMNHLAVILATKKSLETDGKSAKKYRKYPYKSNHLAVILATNRKLDFMCRLILLFFLIFKIIFYVITCFIIRAGLPEGVTIYMPAVH